MSKRRCPHCGDHKDFYAEMCRSCRTARDLWPKPLAGRTGTDHPAWSGGQITDKNGYIKTYTPGHPWPRRGGYVREHVRVMEIALGRRLAPGEVVHHVDGNILNNDLANLRVMTAGSHSVHHRRQDAHLRVRDSLGRFAGGDVDA